MGKYHVLSFHFLYTFQPSISSLLLCTLAEEANAEMGSPPASSDLMTAFHWRYVRMDRSSFHQRSGLAALIHHFAHVIIGVTVNLQAEQIVRGGCLHARNALFWKGMLVVRWRDSSSGPCYRYVLCLPVPYPALS